MRGSKPGGRPKRASFAPVFVVGLLVLGALVSCYPFITPGHPITFDVWPHLTRQTIVYQALKGGFSPFYTFMFYSGYPVLRFYSPLFHLSGALLGFASGGDMLLALRVLLVLVQLASSAAMFWFLNRRTEDIQAAALGTLVYVLAPWRVRHIASLANYPMALFYVLLPLVLLVLDRLTRRPDVRASVLLGLLVGLSALAHVVYAVFLVLVVVVVLTFDAVRSRGPARPGLRHYLLAGAAALGVAVGFVVPFVLEYSGHVYPKLLLSMPAPDLLVLLGIKSGSGYSGGYFGLSVATLIGAGAVLHWFQPKPVRRGQVPGLVVMAGCLVLVFAVPHLGKGVSVLLLRLLPERLLVFFLFFGCGLVGSGYALVKSRWRFMKRRLVLVFALLAGALALDCVPAQLRIWYPQPEEFLSYKSELYRLIREAGPTKVLDLTVLEDRIDEPTRIQAYPAMSFLFGSGLATPLGPQYHQFAPRSMAYGYPWVNLVAADLADTSNRVLARDSRKALALLGISHLITDPRLITVMQQGREFQALLVKEGIEWDTRFATLERVPRLVSGATGAGLVLASSRLEPMPAEGFVRAGELYVARDWQEVLDRIEVDLEHNRASFIPVPQGQEPRELTGLAGVEVLETKLEHQLARVAVHAETDCFLRLALSYYPWLEVKLDGRPVGFHETKDHFIWLEVPEGVHEVEVSAPFTPIRSWTLVLSGLAFLGCLVLVCWPRCKSR